MTRAGVVGRDGEPRLVRGSWAAADLLLEEETPLVGADEVATPCAD